MKNLLLLLLFVVFYAGLLIFTQLLFGDDDLISIKSKAIKIYTFTKTDTLKNKEVNHFAYLCFYLSEEKKAVHFKIKYRQRKGK